MAKQNRNIEALVIGRLLRGNAADREKFRQYPFTSDVFRTYTKHFQFIQQFKEKYGKLPDIGAFRRKFKEFEFTKTKENIEYYCDELVERENLSRMKDGAQRVQSLINDGQATKAMALFRQYIERAMVRVNSKGVDWKNQSSKRYTEAVRDRAQSLRSGKAFTTPYPKLNKYIIVLRPENLMTITARLGIGKTWLLLYFALCFIKQGARVLIISKEMSEDEFNDRLDAIDAKLDWNKFQRGRLSIKQRKRFKRALRLRKKYKGTMKIIGDSQVEGQSLEQLVHEIDNFGPDILMIDGVYQFDVQGIKDEMQKMIQLSRRMKRIAKARKLLLIQTVQQNRSAEGKKGGGGVAAISWTDSIGMDSDLVVELVAPDGRDSEHRILKIIKGRNSGYGEVAINFKMRPYVDLTEMYGSAKQFRTNKSVVKLQKVPK